MNTLTRADWKLLVEMRNRKKTAAVETAMQERRAAEESLAQAAQARLVEQQRILDKKQHWQTAATASMNNGFSVAQLRAASAWSQALDAKIKQAHQDALQAQLAASQRLKIFEASKSALLRASRNLDKAEQMQRRAQSQHAHTQDMRTEAVSEEVAIGQWTR